MGNKNNRYEYLIGVWILLATIMVLYGVLFYKL